MINAAFFKSAARGSAEVFLLGASLELQAVRSAMTMGVLIAQSGSLFSSNQNSDVNQASRPEIAGEISGILSTGALRYTLACAGLTPIIAYALACAAIGGLSLAAYAYLTSEQQHLAVPEEPVKQVRLSMA